MDNLEMIQFEQIKVEEHNLIEDLQNQQSDIIIIDSEDEQENLETMKFEVGDEESFVTVQVLKSVPDKIKNTNDGPIEHINLNDLEEDDWKEPSTFEEDPLALNSPLRSSKTIRKERDDEVECLTPTSMPSSISPMYYRRNTITIDKTQERDDEVECLTPTSMPSSISPMYYRHNPVRIDKTQERADKVDSLTPTSMPSSISPVYYRRNTIIIDKTQERDDEVECLTPTSMPSSISPMYYRHNPVRIDKIQERSDEVECLTPTSMPSSISPMYYLHNPIRIDKTQAENTLHLNYPPLLPTVSIINNFSLTALPKDRPILNNGTRPIKNDARIRPLPVEFCRINKFTISGSLKKLSIRNNCSKCGKRFQSINELLKHIDTHAVGKVYFCEGQSDCGVIGEMNDFKMDMNLNSFMQMIG